MKIVAKSWNTFYQRFKPEFFKFFNFLYKFSENNK